MNKKQQSSASTRSSANPNIISSLLALLIFTFYFGFNLLAFIAIDVWAGALRGEPEMGWAMVFALYAIAPVFLIVGLITYLRVKKYKREDQKIGPTVKRAGIITAILLIVVSGMGLAVVGFEKFVQDRYNKSEEQRSDSIMKYESIDVARATELLDSCKLKAYEHTDLSTQDLTGQGIGIQLVSLYGSTYSIITTDTTDAQLQSAVQNAKKNCPGFTINGE